jgi:hypothetical protein
MNIRDLIGLGIIIGIIICLIIGISSYSNEPVNGDQSACFNRLDDYFQQRVKHINDTEFKMFFPCPNGSMLENTEPQEELK